MSSNFQRTVFKRINKQFEMVHNGSVYFMNETDLEYDTTTIGTFTGFTLLICILYGVLFCFGISGNLWVVSVVSYILKSFGGLTQNQNVFLYILSLSIVDALVLLNLPMLVSDIYYVSWIFGDALCKMYWGIESINKITSKFILTAMSFDRFLAVCRPGCYYSVRTLKGTSIVLMIIAGLVVVSLYPVYQYAQVIFFDEIFHLHNETVVSPRSKCILRMDDELLLTFTMYLFAIGFCLPSVLITFFYVRILCQLYMHKSATMATTHIPMKRVTCGTFLLILIYFVCWAPFWITIMYSVIVPQYEASAVEVYFMYFVHFMVYVNSSTNWILYAYMNKNLKETRTMAMKRNAESKTRLLELQEMRPLNKSPTCYDLSVTLLQCS